MTFPSPGADWPKMDEYLRSIGVRINAPRFEETEGGGHVAGSEHYQHRARDYPVSTCDAPAVAKALEAFAHGPNAIIDELFFSPLRIWYDSGTWFQPAPGAIEYRNHFSHCHAGIKRGASLPVHTPAPQPPKPPTPPPPLEDEMLYVVHATGDKSGARYLTNGLKRRWLRTQGELDRWLMRVPNHKDEEWPFEDVANMPFEGTEP